MACPIGATGLGKTPRTGSGCPEGPTFEVLIVSRLRAVTSSCWVCASGLVKRDDLASTSVAAFTRAAESPVNPWTRRSLDVRVNSATGRSGGRPFRNWIISLRAYCWSRPLVFSMSSRTIVTGRCGGCAINGKLVYWCGGSCNKGMAFFGTEGATRTENPDKRCGFPFSSTVKSSAFRPGTKLRC